MKLSDLGFDSFFLTRSADLRQPGQRHARVTAVDRGGGLVRNENSEVSYRLAGKLEFGAQSSVDLPCVGDWVQVQYHNSGSLAIIHAVLPRKTFLRRKRAGRDVDYQMIAANIDTAFIVMSCHYDFNLNRLDRYLVMVKEGGIEPVVILTKTDLVTGSEAEQAVNAAARGAPEAKVVAASSVTGAGLDDLRRLLSPGRTYCLLGSSGVGKTTLINRLMGKERFDTGEVSATGEGIHTTARRQLILLDGGAMLIDTPGMRELGFLGAGEAVEDSFSDIRHLAQGCRFSDCTHTREKGCAVLAAVQGGPLGQDRLDNYLKLKRESEYHEMSYLEKRRKDRAFGRFIKSAKKQMKK